MATKPPVKTATKTAGKTAAKPAAKTSGKPPVKTAAKPPVKTSGGTKTNTTSRFTYGNQLNASDSTQLANRAIFDLKAGNETSMRKNAKIAGGQAGVRADKMYEAKDTKTGKIISVTAAGKSKYPHIKTWKEGKPRVTTFKENYNYNKK